MYQGAGLLSGKTPEGGRWFMNHDGKKLIMDVDLLELPKGDEQKQLLIQLLEFFEGCGKPAAP